MICQPLYTWRSIVISIYDVSYSCSRMKIYLLNATVMFDVYIYYDL